MSKFISRLFVFMLSLSFAGFADVFIVGASYDKQEQKLNVSIACGSGYQHGLFKLIYGPVTQTIPGSVTATLTYTGFQGTMEEGACETTLEFDVSHTRKPIHISVVSPNNDSSASILVD